MLSPQTAQGRAPPSLGSSLQLMPQPRPTPASPAGGWDGVKGMQSAVSFTRRGWVAQGPGRPSGFCPRLRVRLG